MIYSDLNPLAFRLRVSSSGKCEDVIAEEGENKSRFESGARKNSTKFNP